MQCGECRKNRAERESHIGATRELFDNLPHKGLRVLDVVLLILVVVTLPHHGVTWHRINFAFLAAYGALTCFLFITDRSVRKSRARPGPGARGARGW